MRATAGGVNAHRVRFYDVPHQVSPVNIHLPLSWLDYHFFQHLLITTVGMWVARSRGLMDSHIA